MQIHPLAHKSAGGAFHQRGVERDWLLTEWWREGSMNAVLMLLALNAAAGFAIGTALTWFAITVSGIILALFSAVVLHVAGFSAGAGIASILACLVVNQAAYLITLTRHTSLAPE